MVKTTEEVARDNAAVALNRSAMWRIFPWAEMSPRRVVQQGLRTRTALSFENCCTHGIHGLVFGSGFTKRLIGLMVLVFAAR